MASEAQALAYLEQHRLVDLVNNMTAQLMHHRPEDPRSFLVKYITTLQEIRSQNLPAISCHLLDETNAKAVFTSMDVSGKGWITPQQYHTAMQNLFITNYNKEPRGINEGRIVLEDFLQECRAGLEHAAATF